MSLVFNEKLLQAFGLTENLVNVYIFMDSKKVGLILMKFSGDL